MCAGNKLLDDYCDDATECASRTCLENKCEMKKHDELTFVTVIWLFVVFLSIAYLFRYLINRPNDARKKFDPLLENSDKATIAVVES